MLLWRRLRPSLQISRLLVWREQKVSFESFGSSSSQICLAGADVCLAGLQEP